MTVLGQSKKGYFKQIKELNILDNFVYPEKLLSFKSLMSEENQNSVNGAPQEDLSNLKVNKKGFIEVDGEIVETLPSITFLVKLENDSEITARLSGRMRMHRIMLLPGDKVKVEMSPYDLTKGRITYRYK